MTLNIIPNNIPQHTKIKDELFTTGTFFMVIGLILLVCGVVWTLLAQLGNGQSCTWNSDCPIGQFCQDKVCEIQECKQQSDCGPGQRCLANLCLNTICTVGCKGDSTCINEICVGYGMTCEVNNDCQMLKCINGKCLECEKDSDCSNGGICVSGICD